MSTMRIGGAVLWGLIVAPVSFHACNGFSAVTRGQKIAVDLVTATAICATHREQQDQQHEEPSSASSSSRRILLSILGGAAVRHYPLLALADFDEDQSQDLTTKLFNADGSLRDQNTKVEAQFRSVVYSWPLNNFDAALIGVDGKQVSSLASLSNGSSFVKVSYEVPEKWGQLDSDLYVDMSPSKADLEDSKIYLSAKTDRKACSRITVYKASGQATVDQLEKATRIGVAKALKITPDLANNLQTADIISGRTRLTPSMTPNQPDQRYYEFDLAVAPATCGSSKEDLGLGFCPYESIFLLSATVVENQLFVLIVECEKNQWKRGNSDVKRVRSSFSVEAS